MTEFNFFDEVDTPKEGVENREKREFLKKLITQGKKLHGKKPWIVKLIDQASNEEVEKLHSKYTQKELQHKGEKTGQAMGKHLIKIYSNGASKVLRLDDMEQLRKNIDEDPIIKDSMVAIGALMVSTFGKWLSLILIVCHTANHTQGFMTKNEKMGNCQSMFSKDEILIYDRLLQNDPFFNSRFNKEALNAIGKGVYAGIRNNYRRFNEKVSLQTGKWWKFYFEVHLFSMLL